MCEKVYRARLLKGGNTSKTSRQSFISRSKAFGSRDQEPAQTNCCFLGIFLATVHADEAQIEASLSEAVRIAKVQGSLRCLQAKFFIAMARLTSSSVSNIGCKDPSMLLLLRWICFFVFTIGVIALEVFARTIRDSYTLCHLTDLRDIIRKIVKVLALIVCLAGSYLLLMPGTFLTIDDNEKWKVLLLAVGVWSALARIRISECSYRSRSQVGWLLGIASASCWMIILFV
jgi:hypothetical protein